MVKLTDISKAYIIILSFLLINTICVVFEIYYFSFVSVILAISTIAILRLDTFLLLIVFFTPLSIPLREIADGLSFDMWLPTEPLLAGLLLLFILKIIKGEKPDKRILLHPVSVAIYINLGWIFITSLTSTMFLVSIKFFLARVWFIVAFYIVASGLFKKPANIEKFAWCYIIPLLVVITYAINRHVTIGLFNQQAAHFVMNPFYTDHTSYGALLAMMIPVVAGFVLNKNLKNPVRLIAGIVLVILSIAIILSYTRAAWVSLLAAAGVLLAIRLRIKFTILLLTGLLVAGYIYSKSDQIAIMLEKNRQQSSANITEHVQSISNITSDVSNLERLNRWSCAWRMFKEKPLVGWGPGTYMFQYAPFQISHEKTPISTNAADLGNAHSEYLGPLSESGVLGMLTFIIIVVLTIITGIRVHKYATNQNLKIIGTSVLLGLITYYTHGVLNNFLDTDKASAPFWGFTAILVVIDVFFTKKKEEKQKSA